VLGGKPVAVAPFLLTGGTDSKHYIKMSQGGVLRFVPTGACATVRAAESCRESDACSTDLWLDVCAAWVQAQTGQQVTASVSTASMRGCQSLTWGVQCVSIGAHCS
jgi:hypothetical protein